MLVVRLQVNGTVNLNPQLYIVSYKLGFDYCNSVYFYFASSPSIIYSVFPVGDYWDIQVC